MQGKQYILIHQFIHCFIINSLTQQTGVDFLIGYHASCQCSKCKNKVSLLPVLGCMCRSLILGRVGGYKMHFCGFTAKWLSFERTCYWKGTNSL